MEDLCATCLCANQKLSYLSDESLFNIYQSILNEIQVYDAGGCPRVCFVCQAALRKHCQFKLQAQAAQRQLQIYDSKTQLSRPPSLQTVLNVVHMSFNTALPVKVETKPEIDALDIKSESIEVEVASNHKEETVAEEIDQEEEIGYTEETFANNLDVPEDKKTNKAKRKRKIKTKIKKKIKKKARNVSGSDSANTFNNEDIETEELEPEEKIKKKIKKKTRKVSERGSELNNEDLGPEELEPEELELDKDKELEDDKDLYEEGVNITEETSADVIDHVTLTPEEVQAERHAIMTSEDYVKQSFKCESCVIAFKSKAMMKKHRDEKHIESAGAHSCPTCSSRFPSPGALAAHAPAHTARHVCRVCALRDADADKMARHAREHARYRCSLCGNVADSSSAHQGHLAAAHGARPVCVQCGKEFSSRKTYRYHINVLHKGQNRFPCPHCGRVYQWKSNLWRHIKNHKARESGELHCSLCDKRFSSVATLRQHERTARRHVQPDQFSFVCSTCGARFVSKTKLKDHVDWEHLQRTNYRCHLCDKPFKSNTSLYVHVQNVHRNKEDKDNLCHVCGKSYQSSAKLKYHIVALHSRLSPHRCALCPAAFGWYSSLYRHVRELHHKVKVNKKPLRTKKSEQPEMTAAPVQPEDGMLHGAAGMLHAAAGMLPPVVGPAPPRLRDML